MNPIDPNRIMFGGPAKYNIVVQGSVDPSWGDRFGGMSIVCRSQAEDGQTTTLVGWIHDQAELKGVLDTLYGLHLPILRIEALDDAN